MERATVGAEVRYLGVRVAEVMRVAICYRIVFLPPNLLYVPIEKVPKILETECGTWVIIEAEWAKQYGIVEEPE